MNARSFRYIALFTFPLFLAACGEGYEMIKTDTMFPYGNARTAGSGVAYVRANMMPEKTLKVEPPMAEEAAPVAMPPPPPAVEEQKPADTQQILDKVQEDMEQMFEEKQRK
jgi:hypothetical protein